MVGSRPAGSLVSIGPAARTPSLGATGSCHVQQSPALRSVSLPPRPRWCASTRCRSVCRPPTRRWC